MKRSSILQSRCIFAGLLLLPAMCRSELINQDLWGMCPDAFSGPPVPVSSTVTPVFDGITRVEADSSQSMPGGLHRFSGDVRMSKDDVYINADEVEYNEQNGRIDINGRIFLERGSFSSRGDHAWFSTVDEKGLISNSRYRLAGRHVRGSASDVSILGPNLFQLNQATYTTCPETDEVWRLNASFVELDYGRNLGTAKHVWLDFMDVPVFYFPYLSFPVAGRKSGLLIPEFGSRTALGSYVKIPFYWNIAPDRDATLSLNMTSKRGLQYIGEFRFLNPGSKGQLDFEYLFDDKVSGEDRYLYAFSSSALTPLNGNLFVDIKDVSDHEYFQDFGDRFSSSLVNHLERRISLDFQKRWFSFNTLFQEFNTLDETIASSNRPYSRLPEFVFSTRPLDAAGIQYQFSSSISRFYHPERVSALRYRYLHSLAYPMEHPGGYIRPKMFQYGIYYDPIDENDAVISGSGLTVPGLSLASGLIFERELAFAGTDFLQTLEPELFYLNVPYKNQDDLFINELGSPQTFDSSLTTLSYANLFQENRFSGGDRVGDAKQVALALSSRFFNTVSGRETLSASMGRLLYFDSRRVTLPGGVADSSDHSDIFGLVRYRPADYFTINTSAQWSTELDQAVAGGLQFNYHPMRYNIVNLGYRIARDGTGELTQLDTDLSFVWKISGHLNVVGRRNRSVLTQTDRELLYGVEYEDCCWVLRVVKRRYASAILAGANTGEQNYSDALMFQVVLKGLTSIGSSVDGVLSNDQYGISGY